MPAPSAHPADARRPTRPLLGLPASVLVAPAAATLGWSWAVVPLLLFSESVPIKPRARQPPLAVRTAVVSPPERK